MADRSLHALLNSAVFATLALLQTACSRPYSCCDVYGADEFVLDSYQIRSGKFAILELEGETPECLSEENLCEYDNLIAEDDVLNIVLYHPKRRDLVEAVQFINAQVGFRVSEGAIQLPDLPPVLVAQMSLGEAQKAITAAYQNHIREVEIFLSYRERHKNKVELAGAVAVPEIPVDGKIRLYEVLAKAQVPNGANLFRSYVLREGKPLPIDLYKLLHEGDLSQNIVMRGGDKIFIAQPSDSTVMVMGEVIAPKPIPIPYGSISLREALVSAGGIPFTGDKECIQVIRGGLPTPKIYSLAWRHIVHLPNESLLLIPGDTVYVSEKPITQWNRFIDQLLPSCLGLQTAYGTYAIFRD